MFFVHSANVLERQNEYLDYLILGPLGSLVEPALCYGSTASKFRSLKSFPALKGLNVFIDTKSLG